MIYAFALLECHQSLIVANIYKIFHLAVVTNVWSGFGLEFYIP